MFLLNLFHFLAAILQALMLNSILIFLFVTYYNIIKYEIDCDVILVAQFGTCRLNSMANSVVG